MKLACEKCKKVFVVRTYEVKTYKVSDFICPDCRTPLKKTGKVKEFKVAIVHPKSILTDEALNKGFIRRLNLLMEKLTRSKVDSLNLIIN